MWRKSHRGAAHHVVAGDTAKEPSHPAKIGQIQSIYGPKMMDFILRMVDSYYK